MFVVDHLEVIDVEEAQRAQSAVLTVMLDLALHRAGEVFAPE